MGGGVLTCVTALSSKLDFVLYVHVCTEMLLDLDSVQVEMGDGKVRLTWICGRMYTLKMSYERFALFMDDIICKPRKKEAKFKIIEFLHIKAYSIYIRDWHLLYKNRGIIYNTIL